MPKNHTQAERDAALSGRHFTPDDTGNNGGGKMAVCAVRLPHSIKAEIEKIAADEDRSTSSIFRIAIKEWLEARKS